MVGEDPKKPADGKGEEKNNPALAMLQMKMESQFQMMQEEQHRMQAYYENKIAEMKKKEADAVLEISDGEEKDKEQRQQLQIAPGLGGALTSLAKQGVNHSLTTPPFGVQRVKANNSHVSSPYGRGEPLESNGGGAEKSMEEKVARQNDKNKEKTDKG